MTYYLRKLLDELMGENRNGDRSKDPILHYSDKRVCKYDLCGLCPYKLFPNTKQDLGACPFEVCPVPPNIKNQYEKAKEEGTYDPTFERDLEGFLEKLVHDCDERIVRHNKRLENQHKNNLQNEPEELRKIKEELIELTQKVDELGQMGEIDQAQQVMMQIDALKKQKESLEAQNPNQIREQHLIVCEVCAALLSINESDQRLTDHFAGKMHLGFQLIRDKLAKLKKEKTGRKIEELTNSNTTAPSTEYYGGATGGGRYSSSSRSSGDRRYAPYESRSSSFYSSRGRYPSYDSSRRDRREKSPST